MNNYSKLREANENRNGVTRERAHNNRVRTLPLIDVTEVPHATLEEREILLDLGIIDTTGALSNDTDY